MKTKLQLDWLPLPKEAIEALGLKEGDVFDVEVVGPDTIIFIREDQITEKK